MEKISKYLLKNNAFFLRFFVFLIAIFISLNATRKLDIYIIHCELKDLLALKKYEAVFTQEHLYSNLKDFSLDNEVITSTSNDPWIFLDTTGTNAFRYIKLNIGVLDHRDVNGQFFYLAFNGNDYFNEDESTWKSIRTGINYIKIPMQEYKALRLDLCYEDNVSFVVNSVELTNRFVPNLLDLLLLILLNIFWCGLWFYLLFERFNKTKIENLLNLYKNLRKITCSIFSFRFVSPKKNILICLFLCVIFFSIVMFIYPVQFETNDDSAMMYLFAGYSSGSSQPYTPFSPIIYGEIIGFLYLLFPALPIYLIFHVVVMFFSSVIITYCIIKTAITYNTSFITGILFCLLFLCLFALRSIILIQFTTTAAFPAAAAIALALIFIPTNRIKTVLHCAIVAALGFLSYVIRIESFIPAAIIIFSILFFKVLKNKKYIFSSIIILSFITISVATVQYIKAIKENTPEWIEFNEYYRQFTKAMGYGAFSLVSPQEIGIDIDEFNAIARWNILTESYSLNFLKKVNILAETKRNNIFFFDRAKQAAQLYLQYFSHLSIKLLYFIQFGMVLFIIIRYINHSKNNPLGDVLKLFYLSDKFLFFIIILFHCFVAYLCYRNRFPERVLYLLILLFSPSLLITLCALQCARMCAGRGVMLIACIIFSIVSIDINSLYNRKNQRESKCEVIEQYALSNPEKFIIYDINFVDAVPSPYKVFEEKRPINLTLWGGWYFYTPAWHEKIQQYGLDNLDYKSFLKDNVYYMSTNTGIYTSFKSHMENRLDGTFHIVDQLEWQGNAIYINQFILYSHQN